MDKQLTSEELSAWRQNLKVDDLVIVSSGYGENNESIRKVARTTKAQFFLTSQSVAGSAYEVAYWKKDGRPVGADTWSNTHVSYPYPEQLALIREKNHRAHIVNAIRKVMDNPGPISTLALDAIGEIIKPYLIKKEG